MHSAIYHGWLRHRRFAPHAHAFRYRLFMMYLDLAELDEVFRRRWLWSARHMALARFDRRDHFGDPEIPLDEAVRDLVTQQTGRRPTGPIRLLTHLRYFGYCFNPVSFYYCFGNDGSTVETVVAEITNTPWGERHCYVLTAESSRRETASGEYRQYRFDKAFHVSPFMPMNIAYQWGFNTPGEALNVHMALQKEKKIFDATMHLERRPITGLQLAGALIRHPSMTLKVMAAIHWEALKLWIKRVPIHTHPEKIGRAICQNTAATGSDNLLTPRK